MPKRMAKKIMMSRDTISIFSKILFKYALQKQPMNSRKFQNCVPEVLQTLDMPIAFHDLDPHVCLTGDTAD